VIGLKKDIAWIAGGQIVGVLSNFLLLNILTDSLTVSAYGYFTLWVSVVLFARQIIYDPVSIVAAKEAAVSSAVDGLKLNYFNLIGFLTDRLMSGLLLIGLSSLICEVVFFESMLTGMSILSGCIYLSANGAHGIYINLLNALKLRGWAALGITADSFVKVSMVILIFSLIDCSFAAAAQAVAVSSLLVFVIMQRVGLRFVRSHLVSADKQWLPAKQLIVLSLPLVAPSILTALKGIGDKVFMASFVGIEQLAAYNVLLQLGFIPMMLIVGVIQTYVSPNIYILSARGDAIDRRKLLVYLKSIVMRISIVSLLAVMAAVLLSDAIFKSAVGFKYVEYGKYLPYFVLAGSLSGIAGLLNLTAIGVLKSNRVGIVMFLTVLIGLILSMVVIAVSGFIGAVIGLIFSNLFMLFVFGAFVYHAVGRDCTS
jgi:O-antigen/teichoic acid export membrane protein